MKKIIFLALFLFYTGILSYNNGSFNFDKSTANVYFEKSKVLFMELVDWVEKQK